MTLQGGVQQQNDQIRGLSWKANLCERWKLWSHIEMFVATKGVKARTLAPDLRPLKGEAAHGVCRRLGRYRCLGLQRRGGMQAEAWLQPAVVEAECSAACTRKFAGN